jgi:putative transposase
MQQQKLLCKVRRRFVNTTDSHPGYGYYPNLYQNKIPDQLDRVWVADIIYVRSRKGFVYLAAILDLYSRRVFGWALEKHLEARLAVAALQMALRKRKRRQRD